METDGNTVPAHTTPDRRREIKRCGECSQQFGVDAMFCPFDGTKLSAASWDPTSDPLLGKTVDGRYEVKRVLGEGGMGTVYEVRHKTLGRAFAMKVLRRDIARDAELAKRFIQEAKATAAVKHPHIVSITDFGALEDGTPFFVMELLVGTTLAQMLRTLGSVAAPRAAKMAAQIAGGLGAAHEAGVVHRDLKPDNVFLVAHRDDAEAQDDVRIVDFGAAKIVGAGRLTKTGIVFGTPHYMAPEQASGQPVDQRADIYALGVIMYEMFTGRVPFEADTYMGVLTQHLFVAPTPPSVLRPELGDELGALEEIVLRTLAKKPEDRYPTMSALAAEILRVVRVHADGTTEIAPRSASTPRTASVLDVEPLSSEAAASTARSRTVPVLVGCLLGLGAASAAAFALRHRAPAAAGASPVEAAGSGAPTQVGVAAERAVSPSPPSQPTAVRLSTIPSGAEVWLDGERLGVAPVEIPYDRSAAPPSVTLRAPGFVDRDVGFDSAVGTDLLVVLDKKPPPAAVPLAKAVRPPTSTPAQASTASPPHRPSLGGDIKDPWENK